MRTILSLLFGLLCITVTAQDTIPTESEPDTTIRGTIVIRSFQDKVRIVPRGVQLSNPVISYKKTKPLMKTKKRFRIPSFWEKKNEMSLGLSEVAFVNWNAGGDNAITALGRMRFVRNYKFRYVSWKNELEMRFGWNAQEGRKWRKTEDAIRFSSTFGYRRDTLTNWYITVRTNFNTQFADGFKYPDRSTPISRFMAPGYLFLGGGASYISESDNFNLYISPLTHKSTFVLDRELANKGAFGVQKAVLDSEGNVVEPGQRALTEFGFLVTNSWKTPVFKNVNLDHRISFYTDYLQDFGNIDVDWEMRWELIVNEYIKTSIGTHIIYDDDILFDVVQDSDGNIIDPGQPKLQFKQVLTVGAVYIF
ncbi:DUF3078 domain-containing protein [Zeaxanthinibacter enoshimensis]|uniref:DUF3078 domain-containing protein n=1 Tax=Zeaxanthinibacter enoshimensis TaxID=392009 RepID=A0A4R6TUI8_9FLAO|nr:DUF3078 domain-containing protein [Zeaxanthinibacter enoshimensis]TDQ32598.1 Protein of unknown function (DUF3078) [Zeaxanthinibacter enoshimensis]